MASLNQCLYCRAPANSLEHVLPAAFGEFAGAPNLDGRICEQCNGKRLGLLDEQLARCGAEGFFRKWYGIEGRAHHEKVNPFYRGSAGGRRQEFSSRDPVWGLEVNLEVENGQARQMRELIFVERSGKTYHLPIQENSTPDALLRAFKALGVVAPFETHLSCDSHERTWVEPLLKQAWPTAEFGEAIEGSRTFSGAVGKLQLNDRYFRAIAKIGFHYFLTQFNTYGGHEPMFARIRQFISEDVAGPVSRVNEFIGLRQRPLLREMLNTGVRPAGWRAHLLCAEVATGGCFAHVQMFLTEDWSAPIYTISLAVDPALTETGAAGHSYLYYPDGPKGKFSGEAQRLRTERAHFGVPPLAPAVASGA